MSTEFSANFHDNGIQHHRTVPYSPEQSGVSERSNRTRMDLVRCMLYLRGTDRHLWADALVRAVYIRNREPSHSLPALMTPYHLWIGRPPNLLHLRIFRSSCEYVLSRAWLLKLLSRTAPGLMVGDSLTSKVHKILDGSLKNIFLNRNVYVDERSPLSAGSASPDDPSSYERIHVSPMFCFLEACHRPVNFSAENTSPC